MKNGHLALLRGVNVGPSKRIAMADLRAVITSLGFAEATTLLNSGNVVFSAPKSKARNATERIEQALTDQLGLACRVIVLDQNEVASIVRENPLLGIANDASKLHVCVLASASDVARLEPLLAQSWQPEALALGTRAAYLWCANGVSASGLATAAARLLRDTVTTRNWATMLKIHALLNAE